MADMNRQITLTARPVGFPMDSDFEMVETPIPEPGDGEIVIQTHYMSVDPYMRGRMNEGRSYAKGVDIGEVMVGGAVGEVIASKHSDFAEGDFANASIGWQAYGAIEGKAARKVDPDLAPISTSLGILGMPGATAYFGLLEVGQPKEGETVVVAGAAGAVGSLVGQIARIKGCRAVGISGTDEKVAYVTDGLGFDGGFNYKTTEDYGAALQELCPDGIDVYFDNVGGKISDAMFPLMNLNGRIPVCGQISQYNLTEPEMGPRFTWFFITRRLRMQGFLVFDFADQHDAAIQEMAGWLKEDKLRYREDVVEGLENAPRAFMGMLQGDNIGKRIVKVV